MMMLNCVLNCTTVRCSYGWPALYVFFSTLAMLPVRIIGEHVGVFQLVFLRDVIAIVVLSPFILIERRQSGSSFRLAYS